MIDLHTHTKHSDGTWSVKELLKEAEKVGLDILSITDHDTVDAHLILEDMDVSKYYSGKIIPGIECSAMFKEAKIELLGYNFDIEKIKDEINELYSKEEYEENLQQEFKLFIEACNKNNIKIDKDIEFTKKDKWPIDVVYNSLKKYEENKIHFTKGQWNNKRHFFRHCTCNSEFPLYIDLSYQIPDAKLVTKIIRKAGGKVFLAHPYIYSIKDIEAYLDFLREEDIIDGLETYYYSHTKEQTKFIEEYCNKYNLLKSMGSDCHGSKKKERTLGSAFDENKKNGLREWINL